MYDAPKFIADRKDCVLVSPFMPTLVIGVIYLYSILSDLQVPATRIVLTNPWMLVTGLILLR